MFSGFYKFTLRCECIDHVTYKVFLCGNMFVTVMSPCCISSRSFNSFIGTQCSSAAAPARTSASLFSFTCQPFTHYGATSLAGSVSVWLGTQYTLRSERFTSIPVNMSVHISAWFANIALNSPFIASIFGCFAVCEESNPGTYFCMLYYYHTCIYLCSASCLNRPQ